MEMISLFEKEISYFMYLMLYALVLYKISVLCLPENAKVKAIARQFMSIFQSWIKNMNSLRSKYSIRKVRTIRMNK
jgi:hypothetical protein